MFVGSQSLLLSRLCNCVRMVEQENRDLLVRLLADIHCPMNADTRFFPIDLSGRDFNALALTSVVSTGRFDAYPPSRYSIARRSPRNTTATR